MNSNVNSKHTTIENVQGKNMKRTKKAEYNVRVSGAADKLPATCDNGNIVRAYVRRQRPV